MNALTQSNQRAHLAIVVCRIMGRNLETMADLRDALNERRNMRTKHLTESEAIEYEMRYLLENAPDLLK